MVGDPERKPGLQAALDRMLPDLDRHVRESKGYETASMVNSLRPLDPVSAFAMAKLLVSQRKHDAYISVAPEGHVYGFFFEKFGAEILSVHVGYPPYRCDVLQDISSIRERRVLILEDDVASGTTLGHVLDAIQPHEPAKVDLYLGRPSEHQVLDRIPDSIESVYLAEDYLDEDCRSEREEEFIEFFG